MTGEADSELRSKSTRARASMSYLILFNDIIMAPRCHQYRVDLSLLQVSSTVEECNGQRQKSETQKIEKPQDSTEQYNSHTL